MELPYQHIVYLYQTDGRVLTGGTCNQKTSEKGKTVERVTYAFHAFAVDSGKPLWCNTFATSRPADGSHGEQWQHPVLIGQEAFSKYFAFDVSTGAALRGWKPVGSSHCGTWGGSAGAVFGREGEWDLVADEVLPLNPTNRTGCFINLIPAGGILSVPESSAGCTCSYTFQASMAYVPVEKLGPVIHPLMRQFVNRATVTITPVLPGVAVRYTLDGTDPTVSSPLYTKPFEVAESATVKACIWGPGQGAGRVVIATFVRIPPADQDVGRLSPSPTDPGVP